MGFDIETYLAKKSKEVDKILERVVPRKYETGSLERTFGTPRYRYNSEAADAGLAKPIWDLLDRGGKRWRPTLMMLICESLGGDAKRFEDWMAIPELVHNGTLMVDDIEDSSELRRGKPCTHHVFGTDIAVNAGNAMYYLPLQVMIRNAEGLSSERMAKAYGIYVQEMINISYGQAMDIAWHRGLADADNISEEEYMQMCAFKTGTLARMAAKLGALLAGAEDKAIEKVGRFAEAIGIGFQIQDDVLNLTATDGKGQFVKDYIGEDIHEGKRTLMVIHALKNAGVADRKKLINILKMHTRDKKLILEAIDIIRNSGSIEYAKQVASGMVRDAWKDADKLLRAGDARDCLKAFADFLVERKY